MRKSVRVSVCVCIRGVVWDLGIPLIGVSAVAAAAAAEGGQANSVDTTKNTNENLLTPLLVFWRPFSPTCQKVHTQKHSK